MKGFASSQTAFVVFGVMFIVLVSTAASLFEIEGVNCADPTKVFNEPSENATSLDKALAPTNDLIDVFFGCTSSNGLVNGFFVALKAGMILIFLKIVKDLVPFT